MRSILTTVTSQRELAKDNHVPINNERRLLCMGKLGTTTQRNLPKQILPFAVCYFFLFQQPQDNWLHLRPFRMERDMLPTCLHGVKQIGSNMAVVPPASPAEPQSGVRQQFLNPLPRRSVCISKQANLEWPFKNYCGYK